jgi:L-lactate permease
MRSVLTSMFGRLFPKQFDGRFEGQRAALWLLGLLVALKLVMSVNSLVNTASVASGADGIPLERYDADGANTVLKLFAMLALGQLALALVGLTALFKYRAMVPVVFLLLAAEHAGRRLIAVAYEVERLPEVSAGFYVNLALLALLLTGLGLSLWRRSAPQPRLPLQM